MRDLPSDRAVQWSDLDRTSRERLSSAVGDMGNFASRAPGEIDRLSQSSDKKAGRKVRNLEAIQPHLTDKPITMRGAAQRRVDLFKGGMQRSAEEGTDSGAGWYFEHHRDIAAHAEEHGFPTDTAITASAAMSPLNSPDNEKAALGALMAQERGKEFRPEDLRRSGPNKNRELARGVLQGGEDPHNPLSRPKVHSYREATLHATPDSPDQQEYMQRVSHVSEVLNGTQLKGQGYFDLWGKKDSTEGILSPTRNTAEDSWMNSITMGQPLDVTVNGRTNVGKTIGSEDIGMKFPKGRGAESIHPSGQVTPTTLLHAYNNEATIRAARSVGRETGLVNDRGDSMLPSVAMQEVAWTEARRVANKDPEYNRNRQAPPASPRNQQIPGQGSLF